MTTFRRTILMATTALCMASTGLCAEPQILPLWPEGVPDAKGKADADIPTLTTHLPAAGTATGAAVLICPGGGYGGLCSSYEGHDIAKWLNAKGIAGFVLKYRLNPYRHPVPLRDAQRAMRLIRLNAQSWGVDPDRVGVMGFSAGGHLASTLGTHFDAGNPKAENPVERMGCRPNFLVLVYPVISMGAKTHGGSMHNLLGANPTQAEKDEVSNELRVTGDTPMTFIAHSVKDGAVPVDNSRLFHAALRAKGISSEYLELPSGDHGLGCGKGAEWEQWQKACDAWLKTKQLSR